MDGYLGSVRVRITHGSARWDIPLIPRARYYAAITLPVEGTIPVKHTYPVRLSTDELRQELDAYLEARQGEEKAPGTTDLDRRKVLYFLDWLDSGIPR
jgi:hypothetical protein